MMYPDRDAEMSQTLVPTFLTELQVKFQDTFRRA